MRRCVKEGEEGGGVWFRNGGVVLETVGNWGVSVVVSAVRDVLSHVMEVATRSNGGAGAVGKGVGCERFPEPPPPSPEIQRLLSLPLTSSR